MFFKEYNYALAANLGRPRTVLVLGKGVAETAGLAKSRGANVVALEASKGSLSAATDLADEAHYFDPSIGKPLAAAEGRRFDLAVVEGLEWRAPFFASLLATLPSALVDGGHVLLAVRNDGTAIQKLWSEVSSAGLEVMRTDINPRVVKTATEAIGWHTSKQNEIDLKELHTTSLRSTYRWLVRPAERLLALASPKLLADDFLVVARTPPKKGPLSLTVGMLTLNEKESVEAMIDDIRKVVPDAKILLIDSSSDETPDLARKKGARVVRQLPPRGHGPAMEKLMYEAARESDALIYLDCDFTYPTPVIARIREALEQGADVVNATRTASRPKAMPLPNYLANRTFATTARVVHGVPTTDVHSGMRGYRSSVIRAFDFDGEGDALPLDTLILPARSNYHVVEFPIEYSERVGFSKLAKLRGTLWTFIRIANAVGQGRRVTKKSHYERPEG